MALFIVLWLLSTSSKATKEAIAGYFKDPAGTKDKVGGSIVGTGEKILLSHDNMSKLKDKLEKAIRQMPNFEKVKKHVVMTFTSEGLRIEFTESASGTFFDSGSPNLNADGREIIDILAGGARQTSEQTRALKATLTRSPCRWPQLRQLGTLRRPRQLHAPPDAAERHCRRPSHPSPRLRRSAPLETRRAHRSIESPHLADRSLPNPTPTTSPLLQPATLRRPTPRTNPQRPPHPLSPRRPPPLSDEKTSSIASGPGATPDARAEKIRAYKTRRRIPHHEPSTKSAKPSKK